MPETASSSNRLARESSPYLRQHAGNPVHWQPWGEEAFAEARRRDLPIFLSIGYSSCHWCHVMEKESFSDAEIARLLNAAFVCIKVDREERPDIDDLYMKAAMAMTGGGGWPLTMVLTPERKPIFAATYLPPRSRNGATGLEDVVRQISAAWRDRRTEVEALGGEVMRFLALRPPLTGSIDAAVLGRGYASLQDEFEDRYGGFGGPPKFPTPHKLMFLLRHWYAEGAQPALDMAESTMWHMARGGIHDQLGGGFHRYSTDIRWLVPHFEKMLYDQAMLAMAYTELFQAGKQAWAKATALDILDYVLTRMRSPEGLFFSAEDADSSGKEGAFYTWTHEEVRSLLDSEDLDVFCKAYGVKQDGNYRDPVSNTREGGNILHLEKDAAMLAKETGRTSGSIEAALERARHALLRARADRERPFRDEKCLLDWNGLMLAALAKAAAAFAEERLLRAAVEAQAALEKHLRVQGVLLHSYYGGEAKIPAFLNDHAFYAWGLLELHQATLDEGYLEKCAAELRQIESGFKDTDGGLFLSRTGDVRTREVYDGALPSGSSVAAFVAARAAVLDEDLDVKARHIVEASWQQVTANPEAHVFMLMAAQQVLRPAAHLEVGNEADGLLKAVRPDLHPRLMISEVMELKAGARLCGESACLPAPKNAEELRSQLLKERA